MVEGLTSNSRARALDDPILATRVRTICTNSRRTVERVAAHVSNKLDSGATANARPANEKQVSSWARDYTVNSRNMI